MFDFLKKHKKEEQTTMATVDEKEIAQAKRDIAEKGADSQTEKDRIDESVGEQERRSGNENSQDAKDRVDESEGAKKADEEREEKRERDHREEHAERMARIEEKLDALTAALNKLTSAEKAETKVEEAAKEVYGLGNGVFADADGDKRTKQMSKDEIRAVVNKLM